jgi:hypothetical protein
MWARNGSQPLAVVMTSSQHVYEVHPRRDHRGVELISDALPYGGLWYTEAADAIGYAKFYRRSHVAVIRAYDTARRKYCRRRLARASNCQSPNEGAHNL